MNDEMEYNFNTEADAMTCCYCGVLVTVDPGVADCPSCGEQDSLMFEHREEL